MKIKNINELMFLMENKKNKNDKCYKNCIDYIESLKKEIDPEIINAYICFVFASNYNKIDFSREILILSEFLKMKYNFYVSTSGLNCSINNLSNFLNNNPFLIFDDLLINEYYKKEKKIIKELKEMEKKEKEKSLKESGFYFSNLDFI